MAEEYDAPQPWTGTIDAPLVLFRSPVRQEWLDLYEHVNMAHYSTIGDHSTWAFWNWINAPDDLEARDGHEYVVVQSNVHYIDELALGSSLHVTTQLLAFDDKRYIMFHKIWRTEDNVLAATNEVKCIGFNLKDRRSERMRPVVAERLALIRDAHAALEVPAEAGKGISLKRV